MDHIDLSQYIRDIPDFPQPGVLFKDITTLLKHPVAFRHAIDRLAEPFQGSGVDIVVGMESRGFIFAAPLAYQLGAGFVPVRKMGRLPAESVKVSYDLEYGHNTLEIHRDAIRPGQRVLVVDDLLATGGTVLATIKLVEQLQGTVVGLAFLIELLYLNGRKNLKELNNQPPIVSLIQYERPEPASALRQTPD
ncbi:MAG: adenine phosphoribosyltransferase [Chloroflexi bacterium]|nr:adenine phosphoribosyltransferase [Chloroflexota bacterium]